MSRVRTGLTPDAWKEEQPSKARIYQNVYAVTAEVIGAMYPIVTGNYPTAAIPAIVHREPPTIGRGSAWADKPRCARIMKGHGQPCARMRDHRGDHRTAAGLQLDSARRRAA